MSRDGVEVLAGVNLPMIANVAFERDGATLAELVAILQEIGASSVQNMRQTLEAAMAPVECEASDGL